MSMEIYNVNEWEIIIDVDLSFSQLKKLLELDYEELWENKMLKDSTIFNISHDISKWIVINLKHNENVWYLPYCIPNFWKNDVFDMLEILFHYIFEFFNENWIYNFEVLWELSFNTTEDDYPYYKINIVSWKTISMELLKLKTVEDYKNYLIKMLRSDVIIREDIEDYIPNDFNVLITSKLYTKTDE